MSKRHLKNSYGMTPAEYRAEWGLPSDYPMVAQNYAKSRSDLAKSLGLGRKASVQGQSAGEQQSAAPANENGEAKAPKRSRRAKTAA